MRAHFDQFFFFLFFNKVFWEDDELFLFSSSPSRETRERDERKRVDSLIDFSCRCLRPKHTRRKPMALEPIADERGSRGREPRHKARPTQDRESTEKETQNRPKKQEVFLLSSSPLLAIKRRMIERFRRVCVCVQERSGVEKRRTSKRGKKLRERNREIERRRECNGIAARRNSGARTTEEGLWCAGRAGFPFLGWDLGFGSFSTRRRSCVVHARTHAQQWCGRRNCARYATSFFPSIQ